MDTKVGTLGGKRLGMYVCRYVCMYVGRYLYLLDRLSWSWFSVGGI